MLHPNISEDSLEVVDEITTADTQTHTHTATSPGTAPGIRIKNTWCKVLAVRTALRLYPKHTTFLYVDSDAFVNPSARHVPLWMFIQAAIAVWPAVKSAVMLVGKESDQESCQRSLTAEECRANSGVQIICRYGCKYSAGRDAEEEQRIHSNKVSPNDKVQEVVEDWWMSPTIDRHTSRSNSSHHMSYFRMNWGFEQGVLGSYIYEEHPSKVAVLPTASMNGRDGILVRHLWGHPDSWPLRIPLLVETLVEQAAESLIQEVQATMNKKQNKGKGGGTKAKTKTKTKTNDTERCIAGGDTLPLPLINRDSRRAVRSLLKEKKITISDASGGGGGDGPKGRSFAQVLAEDLQPAEREWLVVQCLRQVLPMVPIIRIHNAKKIVRARKQSSPSDGNKEAATTTTTSGGGTSSSSSTSSSNSEIGNGNGSDWSQLLESILHRTSKRILTQVPLRDDATDEYVLRSNMVTIPNTELKTTLWS